MTNFICYIKFYFHMTFLRVRAGDSTRDRTGDGTRDKTGDRTGA